MNSELYQIIFPNGKRYIGISVDAKKRLRSHKRNSVVFKKNCPLYTAMRKYGTNNVTMEVLCIGPREYILDLEIKAIELFQTRNHNFGYNVARGGETSPVEGIGHSITTRQKMSASQKARKRSPEELAAFAKKGRKIDFSPEHRERLRLTAIARWSRPGEREKQSARQKLN